MNKKLKEKYLQHLEDIQDADHNLMATLYFLHYKLYNKDCMVVGGVPVKNSDFDCFLQFQKDYLKTKNKLYVDRYVLIPSEEELVEDKIGIIDRFQDDQLFKRIIMAMDITGNYDYCDFIDYLKKHPFAEFKIITKYHKEILEQQVEDLKKEIEELQYGCPHIETRPCMKPLTEVSFVVYPPNNIILTGNEEFRAEKGDPNECVRIYE